MMEKSSPRIYETEVAGKTYTRGSASIDTNANGTTNVVIPAGAIIVWISASCSASSGNVAANGCHISVGDLCSAGVRGLVDGVSSDNSFASNCAMKNTNAWTITITATIDAAGNHRMTGNVTVFYYV